MSTELEIEVEDRANVILKHSTGALINLHLDYLQKPPSHTLEIVLSKGMLRWDAADAQLQIYRSESEEWESQNLAEDFERNDLFLALMRHFIDVVENRKAPACTLDDGVTALQIALAVHESAAKSQKVTLRS